jgi:Flp pilus assembly pilin Flp
VLTDLSIRVLAFVQTTITMLRDEERGQDTLEWVLMSGLIAAAIVGVLLLFSTALQTMVTNVSHCLDFDSSTKCNPGF